MCKLLLTDFNIYICECETFDKDELYPKTFAFFKALEK